MKLKGEFEIISVGDQTMAVPVGDCAEKLHGVVRLNVSAAEIFEMLKSEITEDEIVSRLAAKYENSREEISDFVRGILKDFSDNGIIE